MYTHSETEVSISSSIAKKITGLFQYKYQMYVTKYYSKGMIENTRIGVKKMNIEKGYQNILHKKILKEITKKIIIIIFTIHDYTTNYEIRSQKTFDFLIKIKLNYGFIFNILDSNIKLQKIMCMSDKKLDIINEILMNEHTQFKYLFIHSASDKKILDVDIEFLLDNIDFIELHNLYLFTVYEIRNIQARYHLEKYVVPNEYLKYKEIYDRNN